MTLVVTGPVGAGKSTFIRTVSEIDVVDTDRRATDETASLKHRTTVAFDFGRLQFGRNRALHLYGTPGQSRFDFMWDILIRKAQGYVVLVAANRPNEFRYSRRILTFMQHRSRVPLIIAISHSDCEGAWTPENILVAMGYNAQKPAPPVVIVDPRNRASVAKSIVKLVQSAMQYTRSFSKAG